MSSVWEGVRPAGWASRAVGWAEPSTQGAGKPDEAGLFPSRTKSGRRLGSSAGLHSDGGTQGSREPRGPRRSCSRGGTVPVSPRATGQCPHALGLRVRDSAAPAALARTRRAVSRSSVRGQARQPVLQPSSPAKPGRRPAGGLGFQGVRGATAAPASEHVCGGGEGRARAREQRVPAAGTRGRCAWCTPRNRGPVPPAGVGAAGLGRNLPGLSVHAHGLRFACFACVTFVERRRGHLAPGAKGVRAAQAARGACAGGNAAPGPGGGHRRWGPCGDRPLRADAAVANAAQRRWPLPSEAEPRNRAGSRVPAGRRPASATSWASSRPHARRLPTPASPSAPSLHSGGEARLLAQA